MKGPSNPRNRVESPQQQASPARIAQRARRGFRMKSASPLVDSGSMRVTLLLALLALAAPSWAATLSADPSNYKTVVPTLQPGDVLELAAGDYPGGLSIWGLNGTSDKWITIRGPASGPAAVFLGDPAQSRNTVEIDASSYLAIENLTIDGQDIAFIHAVSAMGSDTHHIRIEGCTIVRHGGHQQTVGISTKTPTWGWIIRRNRIIGAGTGIYLGNSDGNKPFIGGLIEYNLVEDPEGYCMQIKHQVSRPVVTGMPTTPQVTIVRHNVFIKSNRPSGDGDRPNLLIGGLPDSGPGSQDLYEVYGNFLYHNPRESLMQAEGRVSIHDNVFVDCPNTGIWLKYHYIGLRTAYVYNNTFYGVSRCLYFEDPATEDHRVTGNLMFGNMGVTGQATNLSDNIFDSQANAGQYVKNPTFTLGSMDFYPLAGKCQGSPLDLSFATAHTDYDRDFNGASKGSLLFRGAYAGEGINPGWQLTDDIKGTVPSTPPPSDRTAPTGSIEIDGGAATTADLTVDLDLPATDSGAGASGMAGGLMSLSNDGSTWAPPVSYAGSLGGWDLTSFGGNADPGLKTVSVRYRDAAGNWSGAYTSSILYVGAGEVPPPPVTPSTAAGCSSMNPPGSLGSFLMTLLAALPLMYRMRRAPAFARARPPR